ncbi:MAG: glucan biosynthesis protein G [Desulfosarcina sp.]
MVLCGSPVLSVAQTQAADTSRFSYEDVAAKAEDQAGRPYETLDGRVPDFLLNINYDQWRDIRFRTEKSLWRDEKLPFEVQFFHPGLFYNRTVAINEVTPEGVRPVTFSVDLFNYGANDFVNKIPPEFGFAGFRLHYPLKRDDYLDEVAVFLGASYFRAVGKGQTYGLSARGLAIDTGLDSGEEFPYFKEFWLEKPAPDAQKIVVLALLDSPSVTGAYRFSIHPGESTEMTVEVKLFRRAGSHKFGIAPLTSMFFYGETINQRPVDDFRPEIHDSDGLLVASRSGEWTWRPLANRQHLFINSFQVHNPAGFGLMQRDRDFDHYQDQETRYDLRPSAWVEPVGDWGSGQVELVQIPTGSEKNDNIVAYWVPAQLPEEGAAINFIYTLTWYLPTDDPDGLGRVVATRSAVGKEDGARKLIVDFKGGKLDQLPPRLPAETPLEARINVSDMGEILEKQLYRIEPSGCWRLVFQVRRKPGTTTLAAVLPDSISKPAPIELRAYLIQGETVLTETWSHAVWP